jgi:hypothetical protein
LKHQPVSAMSDLTVALMISAIGVGWIVLLLMLAL